MAIYCVFVHSVVEVLTQLNQAQRPRNHHRPSSLQLLGITTKAKPLYHPGSTSKSKRLSKALDKIATYIIPIPIHISRACNFYAGT